ncbi:hypothetical protein EB796_002630 [Bugula neritina]|uniref:Uncharacterized protein n=1 Tax=Bugula neritina TaxID=10212 RepID=A0A7J7KLL8_BUGNE|nr:hypothetical protein EB796_002630 [Bugula neritina]
MISISEMLEKLPSAKMDESEQSISIPIREYENLRNTSALHDKQPIIRDLQLLLLNKEATCRGKTQKALDKRLQSEQAQLSIPLLRQSQAQQKNTSQGLIPLQRTDSRTASQDYKSVGVVARATGETESDDTVASLPNSSSRPHILDEGRPIKSLPLGLSVGSPGMSTTLLKRLVQENLKLKSQLEKRNIPKSSKDPERIITDLKEKLQNKQGLIDDLTREGDDDCLKLKLAESHKEIEKCNEMIEMEKIIIESLRQENNRYKKEKEESDNSVKQYKQLKLELCQSELEAVKQQLETTEQEKELLQTNYTTLCSQYHKTPSSTQQPTYKVQTPQLPQSHTSNQRNLKPLSLQSQPTHNLTASYVDTQRYQPSPRADLSASLQSPRDLQCPGSRRMCIVVPQHCKNL